MPTQNKNPMNFWEFLDKNGEGVGALLIAIAFFTFIIIMAHNSK